MNDQTLSGEQTAFMTKKRIILPAIMAGIFIGIITITAAAGSLGGTEMMAGIGAVAPDYPEEEITERIIQWEESPFYLKVKFDETYEILKKTDTRGWRYIGDDGSVRWEEAKIRDYFSKLKEKYDTPRGEVAFTTHNGVKKLFNSENCGWNLNIDFCVSRLEEAVAAGSFEMDPAFNSGLVYSSENGVGDSYVEVDIREQKVYLYEDGECTFSTDCVTGTDGYTDTHKGVFQVQGKASPATLRDVDKNGDKYEQPVEYWIAFNGSQGMHDAIWRGDFGKDYYKTWGSHGCVNLPLNAAKRIYEAVSIYFPVIVW